ncbi:MAG: rRNA maturation RNase YbeY [Pseudomonadales bacterium]|nr:rRNA maturation RNase YbeY [Pseudomonadales bacterium]NIX08772.1 rRNA maturation RNase YbeY [Pseudomonadales bacterium]
MPVDVQIASAQSGIPSVAHIEGWAAAALEELGDDGEPPELCIRIVDGQESRELNARYRGKDKPTNVLSFPADVDLPEGKLLGDVVICAPVVGAEAVEQGKSSEDHFAHMVVHGVLHLGGYDHEQSGEAELMETIEKKILERVGVADPYAER